VFVCPETEAAVLWEAVSADSGAGKDDIAVGGANFDGLYDFDEVDSVSFGECAPLVEKSEYGSAVGILNDFCGFGFDGAVHNGEGEFVCVQDLGKELFDSLCSFRCAAGTDAPKVPYG